MSVNVAWFPKYGHIVASIFCLSKEFSNVKVSFAIFVVQNKSKSKYYEFPSFLQQEQKETEPIICVVMVSKFSNNITRV